MDNLVVFDPDRMDGLFILGLFLHTGLHTPRMTYVVESTACVSVFHLKPGIKVLFFRKNEGPGKRHAEDFLIDYLNICKRNLQGTVKIFSNYSPCSKDGISCTSKFLSLKKSLPSCADLSICFTGLHHIARPSCQWRDRRYRCRLDLKESIVASNNLWRLGRSIRSFQRRDWIELLDALSFLDVYRGRPGYRVRQEYAHWKVWRDLEDDALQGDCATMRHQNNESKQW